MLGPTAHTASKYSISNTHCALVCMILWCTCRKLDYDIYVLCSRGAMSLIMDGSDNSRVTMCRCRKLRAGRS